MWFPPLSTRINARLEDQLFRTTCMIPVVLLVKEHKGEDSKKMIARKEWESTLNEYLYWQDESKGRWTVRLIGNLNSWLN